MYILSRNSEAGKFPVAKFSTKELAQEYVKSVTLHTYPDGHRKFRIDSLLGSCNYHTIDLETVVDLPIDPEPPATLPHVEHVLEIIDRTGYKTKINYGRYIDEMNREKEGFEKLGYTCKHLTKEV